ncbi:hypothetical protein DTL21_26655 [Bremerella cremea]|uniref:NfeD-like C-terminal domain-containing protein n=1 Tax=Blastopirellula marina TaxID=124 RepID=A0A2S8FBX7_9BACT|nr:MULTISPECIES: hypothetical protein [Pirellulaceae]PQO29630.1 hypothetical protein C5Y83_26610 [Blastopirellula marina]RCS42932.1 hypothetical protein DTL21_26655 [Bremerella cremea]
MYWVFLVCAVMAGSVFVVQFLLALLGVGLDEFDIPDDMPDDAPHDFTGDAHGSTWLFGVISFKTVVTAFTFFGIAGMGSLSADLGEPLSFVIAVAVGLAAMYTVHWIMQLLYRLNSDGTVQIDNALGCHGNVYIPIPPMKSGVGKIQLRVQDQIVEYAAQTSSHEKLATGTPVEVTEVISPTIVLVEPITAKPPSSDPAEPEEAAHSH